MPHNEDKDAPMGRTIRLLGACALLMLALALPATPAARAANNVSPAAGPAGTRFHFSFSGYTPGERVDPWVTAPNSRSYARYPAVIADEAGVAAWSFDIPADALPGVWTGAARGIRSNLTVAEPFTVTGADAAAPPQMVEPESGAPGTVFRFRAAGFAPGERIGAWLVQPDGRSRELSDERFEASADASGAVEWVWASPADAAAGEWAAVAQGVSSRAVARIPFSVLPGAAGPTRSISPERGGPGTTFTVVAGGFSPGERVGSWLNQPDGANRDSPNPWLIADGRGEVRWQWTAPSDALPGRWLAVSQGLRSKVEAALPFTVDRP